MTVLELRGWIAAREVQERGDIMGRDKVAGMGCRCHRHDFRLEKLSREYCQP